MASDLEIEAAARGIAATKFLSPEWPGSIRERDGFNASMVNAEWPRYVADARAALEAAEKARGDGWREMSEFCLTPTDRKKIFSRPRPANWKRAYPAQPGTGPEGETCKTCEHIHRNQHAKVYFKCWKMQAIWTGGGGTDVKARAPACSQWTAKKATP